jgi:hypothetical protein
VHLQRRIQLVDDDGQNAGIDIGCGKSRKCGRYTDPNPNAHDYNDGRIVCPKSYDGADKGIRRVATQSDFADEFDGCSCVGGEWWESNADCTECLKRPLWRAILDVQNADEHQIRQYLKTPSKCARLCRRVLEDYDTWNDGMVTYGGFHWSITDNTRHKRSSFFSYKQLSRVTDNLNDNTCECWTHWPLDETACPPFDRWPTTYYTVGYGYSIHGHVDAAPDCFSSLFPP